MAVSTTLDSARPFLAYFIVTGTLSMGYGSVFTLLAEFREKFGFSETELGLIAGVGFLPGSSPRWVWLASPTGAMPEFWFMAGWSWPWYRWWA